MKLENLPSLWVHIAGHIKQIAWKHKSKLESLHFSPPHCSPDLSFLAAVPLLPLP